MGRGASAIAQRCLWPDGLQEPVVSDVVDESTGALKEACRAELQELEARAFAQIRAGRAKASCDESVYVGGPGVAYLFVKAAALLGEPGLLDEASALLSPWERRVTRDAITDPGLGCSLMCGKAGWLCVEALRAHFAGDAAAAGKAASEYTRLAQVARSSTLDCDEWLYGRAGYLHGCLVLRRVLGEAAVPRAALTSVASVMLSNGRTYASRRGCQSPLLWQWYNEEYLGAAHGVFGIIHMLLHDDIGLEGADRELLARTLDWLVSRQTEHGNWPTVRGEGEDHLVHFCHGAPGAVLALCKAHAVLGGSRYLEAALAAGECVWRYGLLRKGPGLCHGVAGNGYALLALFNATGDARWLARAHRFATLMFREDVAQASRKPDHPFSLYEGIAGSVCFLLDLRICPQMAAFPLFELGGLGPGLAAAPREAARAAEQAEDPGPKRGRQG